MALSYKFLLAFTLASQLPQAASAYECNARSGMATVPLLELYTSEGCSSCPPADKWLSELSYGPDKLTVLAFHVDYWNYIGWKDRFSKKEYTARQRKTAEFNHSSLVYTPQFVLNGRDLRQWSNTRLDNRIKAQPESTPRAHLTLHITDHASNSLTLSADAQILSAGDSEDSEMVIAVYENKLSSKINAGENSGRELRHDYVVQKLFGPYRIHKNNTFSEKITLSAEWIKRDAGTAVFVQNARSGEVLQSLQLPFCR